MSEAAQLDPVNYKNGPKNNWRRTAWNAIRAYTPQPKDSIVLYLPGAANLDVPVAERHGFRRANMIAVEREADVARHLRRHHKQTVICDEICNVLFCWPDSPAVSVIVADLVGGFDTTAVTVLGWFLARPAFTRCSLLLNVMRGRECGEWARNCRELSQIFNDNGLPPAHRARHFNAAIVLALAQLHCPTPDNAPQFAEWCNRLIRSGDIAKTFATRVLPSYRTASGIYFDSLVIKDRGILARPSFPVAPTNRVCRRAARRIAAALAIRTMRLRGDFQ